MASEQPIIRIPRVYFDTRDVINMVRLRRGRSALPEKLRDAYRRISNAVTSGRCTRCSALPSVWNGLRGKRHRAGGMSWSSRIEGGNEVVDVAVLDANRATVDFVGDVTDGQEWQLSAQPSWLLTPVGGPLPQSGFVVA